MSTSPFHLLKHGGRFSIPDIGTSVFIKTSDTQAVSGPFTITLNREDLSSITCEVEPEDITISGRAAQEMLVVIRQLPSKGGHVSRERIEVLSAMATQLEQAIAAQEAS